MWLFGENHLKILIPKKLIKFGTYVVMYNYKYMYV